jgi:hypothetical protein
MEQNKVPTSSEIFKAGLKKTEFQFIKWVLENDHSLFYSKVPRKNWILETIPNKQRRKFRECTNLIMVGSGIYPYSMIDIYKRYPHIKQIGLDYDENCVKLSSYLIEKNNMNMSIVNINGVDYDYSSLGHEDLVFFSIDVEDIDKIYSKVIETSKAQPYVCAPFRNPLLNNENPGN